MPVNLREPSASASTAADTIRPTWYRRHGRCARGWEWRGRCH